MEGASWHHTRVTNGVNHWQRVVMGFALEAAARGFTHRDLLDTADGPLRVWVRGGQGPMLYVSAGIHGDEPAGPLAVDAALRAGVFDGSWPCVIAPVLNPEGLARGTRENAGGSDLNRDYLQRQTSEVACHAAFLESMPVPEAFLSLHEDWEARGFYLYEINTGSDHPDLTRELLVEASRHFPLEQGPTIDGHRIRDAGWIFHGPTADEPSGWPEAIFLAKRGCPLSYTFETPSRESIEQRVACQLALIQRFVLRWRSR